MKRKKPSKNNAVYSNIENSYISSPINPETPIRIAIQNAIKIDFLVIFTSLMIYSSVSLSLAFSKYLTNCSTV